EVVAQERPRPQIGLALDEDVVDGVIDVDPEATRRQPGHERPALGGDGRRGAGGEGGHEMSAGAHGSIHVSRQAPCRMWSNHRVIYSRLGPSEIRRRILCPDTCPSRSSPPSSWASASCRLPRRGCSGPAGPTTSSWPTTSAAPSPSAA